MDRKIERKLRVRGGGRDGEVTHTKLVQTTKLQLPARK